jgi:crossover junction endodeoxyribonuclease RuvC
MARMNVRQMWTAKLAGQPVPSLSASAMPRAAAQRSPSIRSSGAISPDGATGTPRVRFGGRFTGTVLGIDPSLRGTGLALVEFPAAGSPILLRCQTVRVSPRLSMAVALAEIHRAVANMLEGTAVRHVALEQTIYVQNFQTAQILGAARGAAIAAAALRELPVFEYPPLRVKQAVAGLGRASKHQVARTVMALLGHARVLAPDEADAAGVALCHAFTWHE